VRITSDAGAARYLVGRKIVAVEMKPFDTGHVGMGAMAISNDPVLVLDDGSRISFRVDETESGSECGISVFRHRQSPT